MRAKADRWTAVPWDLLGIGASSLCLAHCVVMPLFVISLPLVGLRLLASPRWENALLVGSLAFGLIGLPLSYWRQHRCGHAVLLYLFGAASLLIARVPSLAGLQETLHPLGALAIATAHLWNWQLCRRCRACSG